MGEILCVVRGESVADLGAVRVIIIEANGVIDVVNGAKGERKAQGGKVIGGKRKDSVENGGDIMRGDIVIGGKGAEIGMIKVVDHEVANRERGEVVVRVIEGIDRCGDAVER